MSGKHPPKLQPSHWGRDETKILELTKTKSNRPFVFEDDDGETWIMRVKLTDTGQERSFFPSEYQKDKILEVHEQRALQVGDRIAIRKEAKKEGRGVIWKVARSNNGRREGGAEIRRQQGRQQSRTQRPARNDVEGFPTRDKYATFLYTREQAEKIARWAVRMADEIAAPGTVEEVEDDRLVINTTERQWNDERARQSNIATWVILAKDIFPTEFGAADPQESPPDLDDVLTRFWKRVKDDVQVPNQFIADVLVERYAPEAGDGRNLTAENYADALEHFEAIVAAADAQHTATEDEQDRPGQSEEADGGDPGITDDDIPF